MSAFLKLLIQVCVLRYALSEEPCRNEDRPVITFKEAEGIRAIETGDTVVVLHRKPFEIFCSGPGNLAILKDGKRQPADVINGTTISYKQDKAGLQASTYKCKAEKEKCDTFIRLIVDGSPKMEDFRCTSKNLDFLNCTWTSNDFIAPNDITLIFLINNRPVLPCAVQRIDTTYFCIWYSDHGRPLYRQQEPKYTFSMKACKDTYRCSEETYNIDHYSIVKPDPPQNLMVINKTTRTAVLKWKIPNNMVDLLPKGIDHRIEYWSYGNPFRQVNVSLPLKNKTYSYDLELPCANQYYEVRIYIRPKLASQNGLWSDYASISFSTDAEIKEGSSPGEEAACDDKVKESPEVMIYFVRKLRQSTKRALSALKKDIRMLKQKAIEMENH